MSFGPAQGSGGASASASYVTVNDESALLSLSRRLVVGTGVTAPLRIADGGAGSTVTIDLGGGY